MPGFDQTPDRETDGEHISFPVEEMCTMRHAYKTTSRTRHFAFCMLNFPEASKSTTPETLQ